MRPPSTTRITPVAAFAAALTAIMGAIGTGFIVWEAFAGPTIDPGGYEQDHGGYILGVPLLLAAATAALCLALGLRSEDRGTRGDAVVLAILVLATPLCLAAAATAGGVLDLSGLWNAQ